MTLLSATRVSTTMYQWHSDGGGSMTETNRALASIPLQSSSLITDAFSIESAD